MGFGEETRTISDTLPQPQDLLPHEMAFRIGCVGCSSELAQCGILQSSKEDRKVFADNLRAASELTGVPVTIVGPLAFSTEGQPETAQCGTLERPCQDSSLAEIFEEI